MKKCVFDKRIVTIDILRMTTECEGIGYLDGKAVFVHGAIAGERVEAQILEEKKSYMRAKVVSIVTSSPYRVKPLCKSFGSCGGCDMLHISYDYQLIVKHDIVSDCLRHIGGIDYIEVAPTVASSEQLRYRNKSALPVGTNSQGQLVVGYYQTNTHHICPITDCMLEGEWIRDIISGVREYISEYSGDSANIRHLVVREAQGRLMLTIVAHKPLLGQKNIVKYFPNVSIIYLNINNKDTNVIMGDKCILLHGDDKLKATACGTTYYLSPLSFGQVNSDIRDKIYTAVKGMIPHSNVVIDAYSGAGLMTTILADISDEVYGIEIVADAVRDANETARINGKEHKITNIVGDCALSLPPLIKRLTDEGKRVSVVLDPPRKGCDKRVLDAIIESKPHEIVYVSCDPATLSRDLKIFSDTYEVVSVTPYDMFPNTKHVETVVKLQLRK